MRSMSPKRSRRVPSPALPGATFRRRKAPAAVCVALAALLSCFAAGEAAAQELPFRRGDSTGDGELNLTDGVRTLNFLFLGAEPGPCRAAMDTDDSGTLEITDGVRIFNFLFLGGEAPAPPFPDCGLDDSPATTLPCELYDTCPAECFDEAELDAAIAENVPDVVCIPPGQEFDLQNLHLDICPADLAAPCGDAEPPEPGCPVRFTAVQGTLDVTNPLDASVRIHVEGIIDDMPVRATDANGIFPPTVCSNDVTFTGDADVPLVLEPTAGDDYTLVLIGTPVFDRATTEIQLTASPDNLLCNLFEAAQGLFVEDLLAQLEAQADALLADLRTELQGQLVCVGE